MVDTTKKQTGAEEIAWQDQDLYTSLKDPQIDADLDEAERLVAELDEQYRGRIADLSPEEMLDLIKALEAISELGAKPYYYATMLFTVDTSDPERQAFLAKMQQRSSQLSQQTVFVRLEIGGMEDEKMQRFIESPVLADYRHWLETAHLEKPYLLTEPEEKILTEKAVTGRNAWVRYFTQLMGAARYEMDGEELTQSEILQYLYDPDRDTRRSAWQGVTDGLRENAMHTTYVFNQILADKASTDRLRGYPTWITSRNLSNEVDDQSVEALINAVTGRYDVVQRFYTLKRELLGLDELYDYDRYAPLSSADRFFAWDEAQDIVLASFDSFHPDMASVAGKFFTENWIDAPPRPNKRGGAYAISTVPSVHPYIFLNYQGRTRDVETLAHELGHGIHMYYSRGQGILMASTPLTTAETASTFAEMLVFYDLLEQEDNPEVRLSMLTGKIESSFATIYRQISMNRFEHYIHTARREEGELSTERLSKLWLKSQREMFEDSVTMTDEYGLWWSYVPHFISTPGYVYAYAFGELLVLALYARYIEAGESFADRYLDVLRAGGSDWPHEIMKPLGVDLTDAQFWNEGLNILEGMVNDAEELAAQAE